MTKKQSDYWKKNVLSWEHGAYYRDPESSGKVRFLDRISSRFRGDSIYRRAENAFRLLEKQIVGKDIIDVGCASGRFARQLVKYGATHVTGIDVSPEALALAIDLAAKENMSDKTQFQQLDVTNPESTLPEGFLTISLGVIEYFDEASLQQFLSNLNSPYFFFSFPMKTATKKTSIRSILRAIYLKLQHCPGIYFYTLDEFKQLLKKSGKSVECELVNSGRSVFVTNLPME